MARSSDNAERTVKVDLGERGYDVVVGAGLLPGVGERMRSLFPAPRRRVFGIADAGLPAEWPAETRRSLTDAGFEFAGELLQPSEEVKTLATAQRLLEQIAATRHERGEPMLALAGGVVCDVAGFVAAIYRRGVPIVQCPTTLLAMVDASVGGKTGVNLEVEDRLLKNMVGAFWQPSLVVADVATLRSLPERHFRAGLAECLKHGIICGEADPDLFDWTLTNLDRALGHEEGILVELIARNIAVKARIVEGDERETAPSAAGGRALLNLGHTFAHAVETLPHVSPDQSEAHAPLVHGEAVALGLVAAATTAERLGRVTAAQRDRVREAVEAAGLPSRVARLPASETLLASMGDDKKVAGGRLRLVVPVGSCGAEVVEAPPEDAVRAGLDAIRA